MKPNNPEDNQLENKDWNKGFEIKVCNRHKELLPDISNPQTQIMEIKACRDCQSLVENKDWREEFDIKFSKYYDTVFRWGLGTSGELKDFIQSLLDKQVGKWVECMDCKTHKPIVVCIPCRNRFRDRALDKQAEKQREETEKAYQKGYYEGTLVNNKYEDNLRAN